LLSWHRDADDGGLLCFATDAYGDAGDAAREGWFTRARCAELLIDAGAVVRPRVCEDLLRSRANGLLQLFRRKGLLPRTLEFQAALGDLDAVRSELHETPADFAALNEAFVRACSFGHEAVASVLLERLIALDPLLGAHVDKSVGRQAFLEYFVEKGRGDALAVGPWRAFVMQQISLAVRDGDLAAFVDSLQRESWLLGEAFVEFQDGLIEAAALNDRGECIAALLDRDPAILRRQPPPKSQAIEHAITYGHAQLIPLLTRIWPLPDDLPHAAGTGDLARVKRWLGESGAPALGDVRNHFPHTGAHQEAYDDWGVSPEQKVLDTALAWAVINRHFDVADFLLAHGADVSTRWNSHEPASILHHLVFLEGSDDSMRFLIDRGIDMTIKDYRWNATALGWARHAAKDEKMARFLEEAERQRESGKPPAPAAVDRNRRRRDHRTG
jgi:ankyrin repeat protein